MKASLRGSSGRLHARSRRTDAARSSTRRDVFHRTAILAAMLVASACTVTIEQGSDATRADELVRQLQLHHIAATKRSIARAGSEPRFAIDVLSEDVAAAARVLAHVGAPAEPAAHAENANLIPTPLEDRRRHATTLARDIERTLRTWHGVVAARAHIVAAVPRADLLHGSTPARASIVIKHQPNAAPASVAVRELVAGAVADLQPDDVTVVLLEADAPPTAQLTQLGPFGVTHASATWLRPLIASSLGLNAVLAVLLALQRWRSRHPPASGDVLGQRDDTQR